MGVVESPRSVTACTDIGEHLPMLVAIGLSESRRDPSQPTVYGGIVSPCHRHEAERRTDREALSDNVFTLAGVAHRVDDGKVTIVDPRHRTASAQPLVEVDQCGSALFEQGKLVAQATDQSEEPAAQSVAPIVITRDPPTALEFCEHQREELLKSALVEFGAKGFDGASTRAIAARIEAHQPQINYHFESKAALWTAAVEYVFGLLYEAMWGVLPADTADVEIPERAGAFAEGIRRFVTFAAEHPELNQIIVVEGTTATDRSIWMTKTYVKPFFRGIRPAWQVLREAGVAAPIDHEILYYVLIGGASLPYVNPPEVRLLTGRNPNDPKWIEAHAEGLVAILLPGLAAQTG